MFLPLILALASSAQLGLHASPCTRGKTKAPALCGTFGVYENRASQTGRVIPLQIVVIKARHPSRRAAAVIAGGPGQSAIELASNIADNSFEKGIAALRDSYNLVFMDDRGMGGSNQLQCNLDPPSDPAASFKQLFPDAELSACRAKLGAANDLSQYNTNNTTDDLNDVRAALGYRKIVLFGGSYGTFFSLVYMRRHPDSVESAVLEGVAPPHFQPLVGEPVGAQTALDDLIVKCKRDAACNQSFPNFEQHFDALLRRLSRDQIPVTLLRKGSKKSVTVQLSKEVFVDRLRQLLYDPDGASYVPYIVERASRGDTVPLAKLMDLISSGMDSDLAMGAYLSYSCAEFIPFITPKLQAAAAAHSFAGDLRIRAQRHACSIWKVPPMPPSFNDPVSSAAAMLMISGSDDPATPPRYAQEQLKYLPNAKIALVRGAGHTTETPCTDALIVQFVRAQSAKGLDVSKCSAAFKVPRFATSLAGLP